MEALNIKDIHIEKLPICIITDTHTNLVNIERIKTLYPNMPIICLGDITFLFAKAGEQFNKLSIQYFIDNKIPCLRGNHEDFLIAAEFGNGFTLDRVRGKISEFDLGPGHIDFLQSLPRGFRLLLPNGKNYYCFHNQPNDLWSFPDAIKEDEFKQKYLFDANTIGVLQGHLHKTIVDNFTPKRYCIGQLCGSRHPIDNQQGNNYVLLTENGIEFKKL